MSDKKKKGKSDKKKKTPSLKKGSSGKSGKKSSSSTPHGKRGSSSGFFPDSGSSMKMMEKAVSDYELDIKNLKRENQALAAKLKKYQDRSGKKNDILEKEKNMRVAANQERHWLKQKLSRMQLAIEARLKMLGIDFSNCNDLSEALEAAFAAIQKLAAELAKKEKEIEELKAERDGMIGDQEDMQKALDKLNNKVKKITRAMDEQKKQISDRDDRLSRMGKEKKNEKSKASEFEKELQKLRDEIERLKAEKEKQFDDFVDKKADMDAAMRKQKREMDKLRKQLEDALAEIDAMKKKNEELMNNLAKKQEMINKLEDKLMEEKEKSKKGDEENSRKIKDMENEIDSANRENEELRRKLEDMEKRLKKAQDEIEKQDKEKSDLEAELAAQKKKNNEAMKDTEKASREFEKEREKMEKEKKDLLNKIEEQRDRMAEQDSLIADLKKQLADALKKLKDSENNNSEKDDEMAKMRAEMEKLKNELADSGKTNSDKDDELAKLLEQLKEMTNKFKEAQERINDYVNRERDWKCVQTDITQGWFNDVNSRLAEIDDIKADNERLKDLAHKNDSRLDELADENKMLLDEIDLLLRQQAQFRPDSSNHRGEILSLCVSPKKLIVATTASDKTVRLWRVLPDEPKASKQVEVYACARMDGNALSLAFTQDGSYLVAGCAYKNGPDGLLMIWDMTKGDGQVAYLFRSRPSIRFGRAHCVCWSPNSQYIYSGDTTGSIWVWDTQRQLLLAEVAAHKDVVHDVSIAGTTLFSCSLDQSVSSFDTSALAKVKVKKNKVHVHKPKKLKVVSQDKNDKYPYWKINCTKDNKFVLAGSRKVMVWAFDGEKFSKGPRITDSDLDHIKMLHVKDGRVIICRTKTNRAKIFDIKSGKVVEVGKYKQPVVQVGICYNNIYAIVCLQSLKEKVAKPCKMLLWKLKGNN